MMCELFDLACPDVLGFKCMSSIMISVAVT